MKKFLITVISTLLFNTVFADVSCYYMPTYNHYLFKILPDNTSDEDFLDFWVKYVGKEDEVISSYTFQYKVQQMENDIKNGSSENPVLQAAISKNDRDMINYLKDLFTYLNINSDFYNQWSYPTEEQIQSYLATYSQLLEKAKKYNGSYLKDRYALMAMRCMFQLEKYSDIEKYWLSNGIKTQDEYCKKTMTGLFAGALYHQKKIDAAINIFMQIGDIQSVKYCLNEKRNLLGIKERYNKDKNDDALLFLVQDFVNMYQENTDEDFGRPFDFSTIQQSEAKEFITFANNIADKKASKTPLMWKTAAAMVSYYIGDLDGAKKMMSKASSLEGTQRMKDVARVINFFLNTKNEKYSNAKASYYLSEFKWLDEKGNNDYFFYNAKNRIIVHNLLPQNEHSNFYTLLGTSEHFTNLINLDLQELLSYFNYISQPKKMDDFEKYLLSKTTVSKDELYEKIGTRYLGEMNFSKAEEYLSKVPLSYYKSTPLPLYMQQRDYTIERWRTTQDYVEDWEESPEAEFTENQKIQFAREMKTLTDKFNSSNGQERCNLALKLATYCTQASRWGNCWYLLEYYWSVYQDRTSSQQKYEDKAIEYLDIAAKSSSNDIKHTALYAKVWLTWHDYQYYQNSYTEEPLTVTPKMDNTMKELINYWDSRFGQGQWNFQCDCIMDYVRTH